MREKNLGTNPGKIWEKIRKQKSGKIKKQKSIKNPGKKSGKKSGT